LRLEFLDIFVETSFVGDMAAGELQDALATKSVLQRLLTRGALGADERTLTTRLASFCGQHTVALWFDANEGTLVRLIVRRLSSVQVVRLRMWSQKGADILLAEYARVFPGR
jgi:hypothetical protein